MAFPVELERFGSSDLEAQRTTQTISFCDTSVQKIKNCWADIRQPHPTLSRRQVLDNYLAGGLCVAMGCGMVGLGLYAIIDTATNPDSKSFQSPDATIIFASLMETSGLALATAGAIIIDKTRRAPRYQPLLQHPNPS